MNAAAEPSAPQSALPDGRRNAHPELDPVRQARARVYAREKRWLWLLNVLVSGGVMLAFWLGGAARGLAGALAGLPEGLQPVVMAWVVGAVYAAAAAPLTVVGGYVLPRRYGLSTQTFAGWLADYAKAGAIGGVIGTIAVLFLYWTLRTFPGLWWLIDALALFFFTAVLANLAPLIIIPLFFKMTPLPEDALAARLRARAEGAGARVRGVYLLNLSAKTTAANAALMGLGNTRRIVLGDTLLDRYTPDEIEAVFVHELGHHVHRDILRGLAFQFLVTLIEFAIAARIFAWATDRFGFAGPADVAALPLLALVFGALGLLTMPVGNAWSRWVEAAADRYALAAGVPRAAFRSMMLKLADQNLAEAAPPAWVEWLFYDHPSIARRVAMAGAAGGG